MSESSLVISLDFELLWGVFDKVDYKEKNEYFNNTRKVIPSLLKLFASNDIHVTWATVGMLFNKDWDEWMENIPPKIPVYDNLELSPYKFIEKNRGLINEELCFAGSLVDEIAITKGQEIGTHTYSHYYCLESGQFKKDFYSDLQKVLDLAKKKNLTIKSLVFPRNQSNPDYLEVCRELKIDTVRTNPDNWYWDSTQNKSLLKKVFRTGDAYLGLNDKGYKLSNANEYPLKQKASRLLRPRDSNRGLNSLKIQRIKNELTHAAKHGEIYHIWWHPHNFGVDPEGNMDDLKIIIDHFKNLEDEYGMSSKNMKEIFEFS